MIKAITAIKRREDMSVEAFTSHWLERHAEVVLKLPGVVRYHQSHMLPSGYRRGEPRFDGIAEVWFDGLDAMRALVGSAEHDALIEDEQRFVDRANMVTLLTTEHEVKSGEVPDGAVKCIELMRRRPDLSVQEYQRYWREVHGPMASAIPSILRYVQSHPRLGGYAHGRELPFDGAAITWFENTASMRAGATTKAYRDTRADEDKFISGESLVVLFTREHIIKA